MNMLTIWKKEKSLYPNQLNRPLATIYFGGGTPSLLNAEQIRHILSGLNILPGGRVLWKSILYK